MFALHHMDHLSQILGKNNQNVPKHFAKGTILQHAGDDCDKVYLVKSGLLKSYTIDAKGKEHIFIFAPEGWIITDIESMQAEAKAELFIETIEDSELVIINRKDVLAKGLSEDGYKKMTDTLFRRLGVMQRRLIMMMSATAQERYEHFLETYPALPNRVPQRMIASYLGITPEALSKIRGKMARNR